jgi:PiT family inorganic phosphate transporter
MAILGACFILVLFFEFSNGFHDAANAVATVIYTNSLRPRTAVVWSGICNFAGVIVGGIAVAYALVELIPPDVLVPPDGSLAAGMLVSVFVTALVWNVGTWWLGLPNSSSHALIGALIGIAIENALVRDGFGAHGVDWMQVSAVLVSLLISPLLGFALGYLAFLMFKRTIGQPESFRQPAFDKPPVWSLRILLIATCTGVSFAHGTNDGQKSIGLIMLTIIGLVPSVYALDLQMTSEQIGNAAMFARQAAALIERDGKERKQLGLASARSLADQFADLSSVRDIPASRRSMARNEMNQTLASLREIRDSQTISKPDREQAKSVHDQLMRSLEYAPWWVRILSAVCLGLGTMIGYQRIVRTLGERLGKARLLPAQGASAEFVAAALIGSAGLTGYPVSTTHVVTGGIAGTMVASGSGVQGPTVRLIAIAWLLTLPATIVVSCGLFLLLS